MKYVDADCLDRAIKKLHDKVVISNIEHPNAENSIYDAFDAGYLTALESMRKFIKALPEKEGNP